jgi:hypothetical protein
MKNKKHNSFKIRACMFVLSVCLLAFVMNTLAQDSEIITASGAGLALFNGDYRYEGVDNQGLPTFMKVGSFYRISYRSLGSTPGWRLFSTHSGRTYYYAPIPGLALPPQDGWISVYAYAAPAFTLSGDLTTSGNEPPMAVCQDVTLFLNSNGQATLTAALVDGGSSDPDGDELSLSIDQSEFTCADIGDHTVTLTVSDGEETDQCQATVTVADNTAPTLTIDTETLGMWPPNHKYKTFTLDDFGVDVADNCGSGLAVAITNVVSDEPDDAKGGGDGKTTNDIVIVNSSKVKLRAERAGNGDGRVYKITVTAEDGSGNTAQATCEVIVPHDRKGLPKNISSRFVGDDTVIPEDYQLSQNYPNPFNPTTEITFALPKAETVKLSIYNTNGQLIRTLVNGFYSEGFHTVLWNATDEAGSRVTSGMYVYVLRAGETVLQNKMLLMK